MRKRIAVAGILATAVVAVAAIAVGTASGGGQASGTILIGISAAKTGILAPYDLQSAQQTSNQLAIKAVTGDLTDIHDATIAATRAQVTLELVSAVRNKGVEAFNDIMRMQA